MEDKISYEMVEQVFLEEMQEITTLINIIKSYETKIIKESYDNYEMLYNKQLSGELGKDLKKIHAPKTLLAKIKKLKWERSKDPLHYLKDFNKIIREEIEIQLIKKQEIKQELKLFEQEHNQIKEEQFKQIQTIRNSNHYQFQSFIKHSFDAERILTTEDNLAHLKKTYRIHMQNKKLHEETKILLQKYQEKETNYLQSIYKDRKNIN